MIKINDAFIEPVSLQAKNVTRLRKNYNFHKEMSDTLHRMLNAMEPNTYICPHKHENPHKREVFFCLRGRIAVLEFNNEGEVTDSIILDPKSGSYGTEIAECTWHTLIALEPGSVAYEVKDGPYNPIDDKDFAHWAPREGEPGCQEYLKSLTEKILIIKRD